MLQGILRYHNLQPISYHAIYPKLLPWPLWFNRLVLLRLVIKFLLAPNLPARSDKQYAGFDEILVYFVGIIHAWSHLSILAHNRQPACVPQAHCKFSRLRFLPQRDGKRARHGAALDDAYALRFASNSPG